MNLTKKRQRQLLFYCALLAFPILQFVIFYLCVNFNSILLAFKNYDYDGGAYNFVGFDNFAIVINRFQSALFKSAIKNSLLLYLCNLLVGTTLALFFSYYIYKKMPLHSLFKVFLFLPSILSSVVMVLCFKYFTERAIPAIWEQLFHIQIEGLLANPKLTRATLIFFSVWSGFGTQILMYSGAMSGISEAVVEAAKLDGANSIREFLYITLPSVYSTVVTFVIVGVSGIFTNQMNLYSFYGTAADTMMYTFGYYLYRETKIATSFADYPVISALGVLLTPIAVIMTIAVKKLMEKLGPSA